MKHLLLCITLVFAIPLSVHSQCVSASKEVRLKPGVPIYIHPSEPAPIHRAARDLQRDLQKVFGIPSPILGSLSSVKGEPAIVVAGPNLHEQRFVQDRISGREAHQVYTDADQHGCYVVLQGADIRGTIYAIYEFSDRFLDIPPLWYWASWEPEKKDLVIIPADTDIQFASPYVKYRAWFPNDQDLLTLWRSAKPENDVAHLEAMLRLKLNTLEHGITDVESFSRPYTADRLTLLARDYGLINTTHHVNPLGASYSRWDQYWRQVRSMEPPPLSVANLDPLEEYWRYHIETALREDLEMLWVIGFRGNRDTPFWNTFQDAPESMPERAAIIQQMMHRQVELIKEITGDQTPPMRTILYDENSDLFAEGLLRPPSDTTLIWNFVAARRDHFPAPDIQRFSPPETRPIGYYMNFQFTSTGSHLAQAEGPWKMEANYRYLDSISPRPLEFSVVNAGNIREHVFTLSANAEMMWNFKSYDTDDFVQTFAGKYFGAEYAAEVSRLYQDFFNSYWQQKKPDLAGFDRQYLFQDMRYARALERILDRFDGSYDPNPLEDYAHEQEPNRTFRIVPEDCGATSQIEAIIKGTATSIDKLKDVTWRADKVWQALPDRQKEFFNDNLRVQAHFLLELNRVLLHVAHAYTKQTDRQLARDHLEKAQQAAFAMRGVLADAEHGHFVGWYDGDRLFGLSSLRDQITGVRTYLEAE